MSRPFTPFTLPKYLACIFGGAALVAATGLTALHSMTADTDNAPQGFPGAHVAENIAATVNGLPGEAATRIDARGQWAMEYNALSAACQGLQSEISTLLAARAIEGRFQTTHEIDNIDINDKKYGLCVLRYNDKILTVFDQAASLEIEWFRRRIQEDLTRAMTIDDLEKLRAPLPALR